jgi:hypothetical protein
VWNGDGLRNLLSMGSLRKQIHVWAFTSLERRGHLGPLRKRPYWAVLEAPVELFPCSLRFLCRRMCTWDFIKLLNNGFMRMVLRFLPRIPFFLLTCVPVPLYLSVLTATEHVPAFFQYTCRCSPAPHCAADRNRERKPEVKRDRGRRRLAHHRLPAPSLHRY